MLPTRFAQFKPIVEVLAIKLDAPVASNARDVPLGDQVAKGRLAASDVLRCGAHVQYPGFVLIHRGPQTLEHALGDSVGESIQSLIARTRHLFAMAPEMESLGLSSRTRL